MALARPAAAVTAALVVAVGASGCSRTELCLVACGADRDAGVPDGGPAAAITWGGYAATLAVAPCGPSPDPPLVVDTVEIAVDDPTPEQTLTDPSRAGPTLSLPEAVWIASHRAGPSTIFFARDVFPPEAPGRIALTLELRFPDVTSPLCIDARDRGVVLAWPVRGPGDALPCLSKCLPVQVGRPYRLIGLQFENPPTWLTPGLTGELAGCRFAGSAGGSSPSQRSLVFLSAAGARLGPGNAFLPAGGTGALSVGGEGAEVFENFFGVDPLTGEVAASRVVIAASAGATFVDNVLAGVTIKPLGTGGTPLVFRGNSVGVDRAGRPLAREARVGLSFVVDPQIVYAPDRPVVLGPDNFISGVTGPAVFVGTRTEVELVANRISGNDAGIVFEGTPPVSPPVIAAVTATEVQASCAAAARLELFLDPGDQGELSLVQSPACDGTTRAFALPAGVSLPPGHFVTGTATVGRSTSGFSAPVPAP